MPLTRSAAPLLIACQAALLLRPSAAQGDDLCTISNVFAHLEEIKSSQACLEGCASADCGFDW